MVMSSVFSEPNPIQDLISGGGKVLKAPMQGRVIAIHARVVESSRQAGVCVMVIEAMKMEHPVLMPRDGSCRDKSQYR